MNKNTATTFVNETIDAVVKAIVEADTNGVIQTICISNVDFTNGVLNEQFTIIAAGQERAGFELVSSVEEKFGSIVEWALDTELPEEYITLWKTT